MGGISSLPNFIWQLLQLSGFSRERFSRAHFLQKADPNSAFAFIKLLKIIENFSKLTGRKTCLIENSSSLKLKVERQCSGSLIIAISFFSPEFRLTIVRICTLRSKISLPPLIYFKTNKNCSSPHLPVSRPGRSYPEVTTAVLPSSLRRVLPFV